MIGPALVGVFSLVALAALIYLGVTFFRKPKSEQDAAKEAAKAHVEELFNRIMGGAAEVKQNLIDQLGPIDDAAKKVLDSMLTFRKGLREQLQVYIDKGVDPKDVIDVLARVEEVLALVAKFAVIAKPASQQPAPPPDKQTVPPAPAPKV